MPGFPVSMHPRVQRLVRQLSEECCCRVCHTADADGIFTLDVMTTRAYRTSVPALSLVPLLLESGYLFVDRTFLLNDLIHAKFDHEFDIWADSRPADDFTLDICVDFTAEIVFDSWELETFPLESGLSCFRDKYAAAIQGYERALRQSWMAEGSMGSELDRLQACGWVHRCTTTNHWLRGTRDNTLRFL